jgi:uncharacterized membrane protein (DUF2068 family)
VDWNLLACGRSGHVTYAPAEPDVRQLLTARTESGDAWRCLRCGTFVTGEPQLSGPAGQAPGVRRGKEIRSALILRVFAIERFVRAVAAGGLAFVMWRLAFSRESITDAFEREIPILRSLFHQVGYNIDKSKFVGLIHRALTLSPAAIKLVAGVLALYAVIEIIEGFGLWLARRWGEYFAMVATSLGVPYEVYELTLKVTVTKSLLFAVNLALVLYLVLTKRLFGVRGGKHAYEARLRSESVMEAAIEAAAAGREEPAGPVQAARAKLTPADRPATAPGPDTVASQGAVSEASHNSAQH